MDEKSENPNQLRQGDEVEDFEASQNYEETQITTEEQDENLLKNNNNFDECDFPLTTAKYWREIGLCVENMLRLKKFCQTLQSQVSLIAFQMKYDAMFLNKISEHISTIAQEEDKSGSQSDDETDEFENPPEGVLDFIFKEQNDVNNAKLLLKNEISEE